MYWILTIMLAGTQPVDIRFSDRADCNKAAEVIANATNKRPGICIPAIKL